MAKLAVVSGVLFIALLLFTTEASFNVQIGEQSNKCQQQVQQTGDQIKQCQQYLLNGSKYELEVITQRSIRQHKRLKECCQGLENLEGQCRCDAVKEVIIKLKQKQGQEQSKGHHQVETIQEKMERAKSLPQACNLEPHQC